MTDQSVVLGNLDMYIKHHLEQEGKTGSYTLSPYKNVDGVWGQTIELWNVVGLAQPSVADLAVYTEADVFAVKKAMGVVIGSSADSDKDYKHYRDILKIKYPASGWDGYTNEEKLIVAKAFITKDLTQLGSVLTDAEITYWGDYYNEKMRESRESRWKKAVALLYRHMGSTKAKSVLKTLTSDGLIQAYLDGVESKANDGEVGICDYFGNTETYLVTGFSTEGAPQTSLTNAEVRDAILGILC